MAPFWDDVDTRFGSGQIFYEIHTSGYFLEKVNAYLNRKRPSLFKGTWMMVVHWDAVHEYFGFFNPEVKYMKIIGSFGVTLFELPLSLPPRKTRSKPFLLLMETTHTLFSHTSVT